MISAWLTDTVTSDLDRALYYTLLWGLDAVELRTVGSASERVPYVNEEKLRRRLREHELSVAACTPGLFESPVGERLVWMNELAAVDESLAFCGRIGCSRLVVSAFGAGPEGGEEEQAAAAEVLRRAGERAARRGVALAVLNEAGSTAPTGEALARLLDRVGHPSVRAAWSPAEALRAGEAPEAGLRALGARVSLVRFRDGEGSGEAFREAAPGSGAVGWEAQIRLLRQAGFDGPVSLEVHVEPKPKAGLHAATALIKLLQGAGRA